MQATRVLVLAREFDAGEIFGTTDLVPHAAWPVARAVCQIVGDI